jgi:histidyl-tRNA synthetase
VVVIPSSPSTEEPATALLQRLRASGISGIQAYRGNLKRRMELANKTAAPFVIFLNEDGLDKETVIMKDMASGEQKPIRILDIVEVLSLILPPNGSLDEGFTVRVREILALGEAARYPA